TQPQQNVTFNPGDRAVLRCWVRNLGTKTLSWKRKDDGHPLTIGSHVFTSDVRVKVQSVGRLDEWRLIINDVQVADSGVYQCQVSSQRHLGTYQVLLYVKSSLHIHVTGTKYVLRDDVINLMCNVTANPHLPDDVNWFKDSKLIRYDSSR
ncbi:hypothetical protein HELRODRAFT_123829, partial [Helobdella robusta]|uniref:Ig-like domain-containing protein n=1 Tax=Helobdella robusta TaxID=6412 RepID=T1EGZ2_HELRO